MRLTVGQWDPQYGPAVGPDDVDLTGDVDVGIEMPASRWAPVVPSGPYVPPTVTVFLDGVRRVDAGLWGVPDGQTSRPLQALAASVAAGIVWCPTGGQATFGPARVGRYIVGPPGITELPIEPTLTYRPVVAGTDPSAAVLSNRIQEQMLDLEAQLASSIDADLIVLDGPLSARKVTNAVGYIKTHQARYLPATLERVVAALDVGQRTPLFLTSAGTSGYSRLSCYLRLPGPRQHPFDALVRLELARDEPDPARRADQLAQLLPPFASAAHRDARAPQNLTPIGALEQHLRHRLGDARVVARKLRHHLHAVPVDHGR